MLHKLASKVSISALLASACMLKSALCKKKAYVGIDLGTTFSCVAIYYPETKSYDYLTYDSPDQKTLPSTIYFTGEVQDDIPLYQVGYKANSMNEETPNANHYIYGFKRIIGIERIENAPRLANFRKEVSYDVLDKSINNKGYLAIPIKINGKTYEFTPTNLSTMILAEIKSRLDELGIDIVSTCISTPVYFTTVQDSEVQEAGRSAGFSNPIITKEPIAACVSYVDDHVFSIDVEEKVMVFDFGGGTLDISIVEVIKEKDEENPGKTESSIVANRFVGDNFLGGENVNSRICEEFKAIAAAEGHTLIDHDELRLRLFVEELKIELCDKQKSSTENVSVSKKFWLKDDKSISYTLDTGKFNSLISDTVYKRIDELFFDPVEGLFKDENQKNDENIRSKIGKIVLVGGSTRIPYIRDLLSSVCPLATIFDGIDADKAVGRGACKICVVSDPNSGDSSVTVVGAAPLSIGIRLADGSIENLIEQNTNIPIDATKIFTTAHDNQRTVLIDIAMGVRPMFDDNEKIGQLVLELTNPKPRGIPQIMVKIEYFADYSFKVTAEDAETHVAQSAEFKPELGKPSQQKVNEIVEIAKKNKAKDAETAKRLDQFRLYSASIDQFEAQLNMVQADSKINMSDLDKSYFNAILKGEKEYLETSRNDPNVTLSAIQAKMEALQQSAKELVEKVKASQTTTEGSPKQPEDEKKDEKTEGKDVL
ncbi:hypothetical protein GINT2_000665 [Glugoides intestinalis]